jgi:L-lactate utilization protein LutC
VINSETKSDARETIFRSIRSHLAASVPHNAIYAETGENHHFQTKEKSAKAPLVTDFDLISNAAVPPVERFSQNLEAVDSHCILANGEIEVARALTGIIAQLQGTKLKARRIALSDEPAVERLSRLLATKVDQITVAPDAAALFGYDVGITTVQAAIAETGTLVLDSEHERHRLVSLVPPVHIAIVEAAQIYQSLGEVLTALHQKERVSSIVTFITGPSRTADIELTLAIGVHGPQELYVIVNEGAPLRDL